MCPVCGKQLEEKIINDISRAGEQYDIAWCRECDAGITVPQPSYEKIAHLYEKMEYRGDKGKRFNPVIESMIKIFRFARKRRITQYVKKGALLDIGCGRGLFLNIMQKSGWDVMGTEYDNETASMVSKETGITVRSGKNALSELASESFDVIIMNHVLEHMFETGKILNEMKRLLKANGLFVVAVPDLASLQAKIGKEKWFHLDVPYHVAHYSERGLRSLLEKHSLRVEHVRRFDLEYNPFGWLQTLLNMTGIRYNYLYDLLKSKTVVKRKTGMEDVSYIIFHLLLLPFIVPLSLVLSLFESYVLRGGGTVEIFAFKEVTAERSGESI